MNELAAIEVDMTSKTCVTCGVVYGLPATLATQRRTDGDWVYCPNGHAQRACESTEQRLKKMEQLLLSERASHDQTRARLRDKEAEMARAKHRVGNGVCPCCHRTFKQLARHMKAKHPKYAQPEEVTP